ncbi:hepatocyte growth factor-like protein isoform X2 [Parus major]|uniref:hepatocyte growth factor-like protein isoform X2 n=1 Tax=Parus major TaxID=9157 RepID=UPI0014439DB6|nr:hepatocyte growth factor-like protein isoform X2 [Parus major]
MQPVLGVLLALAAALGSGHRSPLNDFQRLRATELLAVPVDPPPPLPEQGTAEQCAQRCATSLACRAFHHDQQSQLCQLLPWTQHSPHIQLQKNIRYDLYQKKDYLRDCIVGDGSSYRGTRATTEKGLRCQHWQATTPHDHRFLPSPRNGLEENYCRNPDRDKRGPWCYTVDPNVRHQSCGIKKCEDAVCMTCNGEDYRGTVDHTESGTECQRWDLQHPHKHPYHPNKYPDKGLDDNYCRNPDSSERPWCYTTDPRREREYCHIRICKKRPRPVNVTNGCFRGKGEGYRGRVNVTVSGIPCQRWDSQVPHKHHFMPSKYPWTCRRTTAATLMDQRHRGASLPAPLSALPSASTSAAALMSRMPKSATTATASTTTATSARHGRESPASPGLPRHPTCPRSHLPHTLRHTWRRTTAATLIMTAMAPGATPWTPAPPLTIVLSSPVVSPFPHPCRARGDLSHTQGSFGPLRVAGSCASATPLFSLCSWQHGAPHHGEYAVTFEQCGQRDERLQQKGRIVGGQPGNSPWTVSIRNREGVHFCGGSLVKEQWVISTRQCFSSCNADLTGYEVQLGTLFKDPGPGDPDQQTIPIVRIVCGPSESQLVMLKLARPATLTRRVALICLPPERYVVPAGTVCEIAGWGETRGTADGSVLNVAQLPVLAHSECNRALRGRLKESELCTAPLRAGVGACEGDYGGPLACLTADCWVLEGVITPSRVCARTDQPALFIRVSLYVDWIDKVMKMG